MRLGLKKELDEVTKVVFMRSVHSLVYGIAFYAFYIYRVFWVNGN
jgi:hypothetical protein